MTKLVAEKNMVPETTLGHDFMVIIDTNRFEDYTENKTITPYCACSKCNDFFKNKKERSEIKFGRYFITESVFGEIIQQRKDYYSDVIKNLEEAIKPFGVKFDVPKDIDFEEDLKKYLNKYDIKILPHPDNTVFPKIIKRALDKRLPFKPVGDNQRNGNKGSDKGFKDVLLWETLLNFDYENKNIKKVFFITANTRDFPEEALLPEWLEFHPDTELFILQSWDDFEIKEKAILPELIINNNLFYQTVFELFQNEDPDIIELPNFKKKITGRKNSSIIEIDADIKRKDGSVYTSTYYYDVRVSEPTLFDPDDYDKEQESSDEETMAED